MHVYTGSYYFYVDQTVVKLSTTQCGTPLQSANPDFCYHKTTGAEIAVGSGCGCSAGSGCSGDYRQKFVRNCNGAVGRVVRIENTPTVTPNYMEIYELFVYGVADSTSGAVPYNS